MSHIPNATQKVLRKDLEFIMGVSDKTARKEYRTIMDCLEIVGRKYLTFRDLEKYGLIELNATK